MRSRLDVTRLLLEHGFQVMMGHPRGLQLEEALFVPAGVIGRSWAR